MLYNRQPYNILPPSENIPIRQHLSERLMGWAVRPTAFRFLRLAYNRQPYNRLIQTEDKIYISANLQEKLSGWMNIGAKFYITQRLSESLRGNAKVASGVRLQAALAELLEGSASAVAGIQVSQQLKEALVGDAHLGARIYTVQNFRESVDGDAHLGANLYTEAALMESVSGSAHMGANLYVSQSLYEVLNGYAYAGSMQEYVTRILEAIPPGATLVIDADNYNVTLQQGTKITDVIHWHKGDWLWIDRSTISFTLSGIGSSKLQWEVFYHALYL